MGEKVKVGIASSHVDTVTNVCNYLDGKGFKSSWVYNNEEIINMCSKENPDVVIIGVSKEKPEGFDIAKQLGNRKVLFISAEEELAGKANKIRNCVGFVKKPIDLEELEERIKSALKGKNSEAGKKKVLLICF